jgi:ribosome maturation factor RimP
MEWAAFQILLYRSFPGVSISTAFEQLNFESGRFGRFFCSMGNLPERVENEIEEIVTSEGMELVHIEYKKQGRGYLLRVDIDKDGGVTLDDCQLVSQQISTYLDVDDVVPAEYELQVSSPGLDRKFYKDSDYEKFTGRLVRVKTAKPVRGLHVIVGRLKEFDGNRIVVTDPAMKKDPDYEIPLADIKETRLEVEM